MYILKLALVANLCVSSKPWLFTPDPLLTAPHAYGAYQLGPVCTPEEPIRTPSTVAELISIVREALARRTTVKAFGHRHSATDIICTNGIPVDMLNFRAMKYNEVDQTMTVGAGAFLRDVCGFAQVYDRAFRTTPGYGHITIGGAIGTGAHGSSMKHSSSISEQVVGLTIVDGLGRYRVISKESDLQAFRVHLGLLGIIVSVTLATSPLYKVHAHNYVVGDAILTNGVAAAWARETDQISLYWFPSMGQVVVANWTIVDMATPGNAFTYDHVPSYSKTFSLLSSQGMEVLQSLNAVNLLNVVQGISKKSLIQKVPDFVPIYTEDGFTVQNPAVGIYHLMFAPICSSDGWFQCPWFHGPNNFTFVDNEVAVALDELPSLTHSIKAILNQSPAVFPFQGILLRFSRSSNSLMANSFGRDTVHVEWYTGRRKDPYGTASAGLAAYQAIMQTMVKDYGGRSHWGKSGHYYHSTPVLAQKVDPNARVRFLRKMHQYDPHGVFLNDFGLRMLGVGTRINIDPFTRHCALLDNCVCYHDSDCAPGQICTVLNSFPVCSTPRTYFAQLFSLPLPSPTPAMIEFMKWILGIHG